jgi:hypothetical protein
VLGFPSLSVILTDGQLVALACSDLNHTFESAASFLERGEQRVKNGVLTLIARTCPRRDSESREDAKTSLPVGVEPIQHAQNDTGDYLEPAYVRFESNLRMGGQACT